MNVMDAIMSRKSVRSFTGQISEAELQTILMAAQAAPVGMAAYENVNLSVITDKDLLQAIDDNAAKSFNRSNMLYGAPTLILVSTKIAGSPRDNVAYSNAASIVENMALAAVELGIGACHIWGAVAALAGNIELVAKLKLPAGFTPVCAIALGKTKEKYEKREIPANRIAVDYL